MRLIEQSALQVLINTPLGARAFGDTRAMRAAAIAARMPLLTTLSAAVNGIAALQAKELSVRSMQTHCASNRKQPEIALPY